jgi:hypothetical protein
LSDKTWRLLSQRQIAAIQLFLILFTIISAINQPIRAMGLTPKQMGRWSRYRAAGFESILTFPCWIGSDNLYYSLILS